jgi:hypothetical protein
VLFSDQMEASKSTSRFLVIVAKTTLHNFLNNVYEK